MPKTDKTIYLSIDIEADGPIPGVNSMLSFGAAAFDLDSDTPRVPIDTFERNLELLPDARPSESTMAWWATQSKAWAACRENLQSPIVAMTEFVAWCRTFPGALVVVGYPVTFDFMFVYWYTMRYGCLQDGEPCPFGFQGLDIKTLAACKMDVPFRYAIKRNMPRRWFAGAPKHTHKALDDAIGQGVLFVNMVEDT